MSAVEPRVTVLMATRDARAAVRLTLESFAAHTPEPVRFVAADNGSRDGALAELASRPWVEVVTLAERAARRRDRTIGDLARHPVALDDLAAGVGTPYLLTLDSDVELLRSGWLSELLDEADRGGYAAVGEHEPAIGAYRPRLALHLLLVRTSVVRELGLSFAGFVAIDDPAEAARFAGRHPPAYRLTRAEVASFQTARFYPPGAALLERLEAAGQAWAPTPASVRAAYRHYGHMSWAGADAALGGEHRRRSALIAERLQRYGAAPPQEGARRG